MRCPGDVLEVVTEIIRIGLLRIRIAGWQNEPARCAIEANHIHNLPSLISGYKPELLEFYWKVERPEYIAFSPGENLISFETQWKKLEAIMKL